MATTLDYLQIVGYDGPTSGDPVAEVIITGINLQGGAAAVADFTGAIIGLVRSMPGVSTTVTTKYEKVSTIL
jgi:hypothetical protein